MHFSVGLKYNSFETNELPCRACGKGEGSCEFQGRGKPGISGDPAEAWEQECVFTTEEAFGGDLQPPNPHN